MLLLIFYSLLAALVSLPHLKYYGAFVNYGSNDPAAQIVLFRLTVMTTTVFCITGSRPIQNPTGPYPIGFSGTEGSATAGPQAFHNLYGSRAFPLLS